MLRIFSEGERIACTSGDTLSLNVTAEEGFDDGSRLVFQVAEEEAGELLINKSFELSGGSFEILLEGSESEKLKLGSYIYRITIVDKSENIVTRKSGELFMKWGA